MMFGAGSGYLSQILGGHTIIEEINNIRDPYFGGINPEPIYNNLSKLMSLCKSSGLVGLALDGDADRIGAVQSDGTYINTHQIYTLLLYHLYKNRKLRGEVVKTFNMTIVADKMCSAWVLKLNETPIGFKYICDLMLQKDILLGGEESGGMGIKGHIPERDGILCALMLIELMVYEGKSLDHIIREISDQFGRYYYDRVDLHLNDEQKSKTISKVKALSEFGGCKICKKERLDGEKLFLDDESWILFRASGTEPLLRIYCEAKTASQVKHLLDCGRQISQ